MANSQSGIQKLKQLVNQLGGIGDPPNNRHPIVLVAGFASFGDPLFGSINYWGGFEDLALALQEHMRVPVILPRIGPFSSNWERACELYSQLWNIQRAGPGLGFDTRATTAATSLEVNYGQYVNLPTAPPHSTKKAIVLGEDQLPAAWQWGETYPVHMICHSQGGNTVRLLGELLSGNHGLRNPAYFSTPGRQNFIRSVITLGTPYRGTSLTDVIFNEILRDVPVLEVISRLVVSACRDPRRFVDLQLDHWGFAPLTNVNETFVDMLNRLRPVIGTWWNGNDNAVRDNGIAGIARLNVDFNPTTSLDTYYFTMSFDATRPLPWFNFSGQDMAGFPLHPFSTLGGLMYPGPGNMWANFNAVISGFVVGLASAVPGAPNIVAYARWAANVANDHLRNLGYQIRIPSPGGRIPRADMLPALSLFSIGMSGMSQTLGLSEQNDGVVDTSSMNAPATAIPQAVDGFNAQDIPANRGVYWDLGLTEGIDHADQIGVFTDPTTYAQVLQMYRLLGNLVSYL